MMLLTIEFDNLHTILRSLYSEMMPLCSNMAGVAKGIAGLGALFYVAVRVWQSLARAEAIDVYPLLRPFAVGFCIMFFPTFVLGTINGVLSPVVQGTNRMLETQTMDMNQYREQKDKLEYEAMMRNPETAYLVSNEEFDRQLKELGWSPGDMITMAGMYIERGAYNMKKGIRDFFREVLELLFAAAALLIDTLRTFFLIVLSILGPIAFAISVWDGFHSTLTQWVCRYVQVYLWLPVADLFSTILAKIQVLMLQNDISELQNNPNFSLEASNGVYIVFLIIGIIGYFTIPTVAGWIIQAGGAGSYGRAVTQLAGRGAGLAGGVVGAAAGNVAGRAGQMGASAGKAAGNHTVGRLIKRKSPVKSTKMEFKSLKNIESSFRQIRLFGMIFLALCALVAVYSVWSSYRFAEQQREKIYVLDGGKSLMLALSQDLTQNRPAEAREHVRRFHELFFTLSPEKSAIEHNIKRALLLADKSVYNYYSDFSEKGYYNRIIAGNINQVLQVDSVVCDFDRYPYRVNTYARQMIIRESNVTERSLVTSCRLLNASRSDDNPNGFTIEGFTILENRDLQTLDR